jgi:hypothetical protein
MPHFIRVAHRKGWQIEIFKGHGLVESSTVGSRDEALVYAKSLKPDWIEVGDIADLGTPAQRHVWTTLRRQADGSYAPSALKWERGTPA